MAETKLITTITKVIKRSDLTIDIETYYNEVIYPTMFCFIADNAGDYFGVSHDTGDLITDISESGVAVLLSNGSAIISAPVVSGFGIDSATGQLQYTS